jgi:hypothetical protein
VEIPTTTQIIDFSIALPHEIAFSLMEGKEKSRQQHKFQ